MRLYTNYLKNRFLPASALLQNFCLRLRLAYRQWSLAPDRKFWRASLAKTDSSSSLCIVFIAICFFLEAAETNPKSKKYNLSICTTFKNEAKYLKEWIEFHRLIGVDHFYLYNTGSKDSFRKELKEYIAKNIVTLIHWPAPSKNQGDTIWSLGTQLPAYGNAIYYTAVEETKWLVFVDIDEFLVPMEENSLPEVLEKYKNYPGIVLSKTFFDASRVDYLPKRTLVIESVEMTAPPLQNPLRSTEKIIFKPELCVSFTWPPCRFVFKDNQVPVKLNQWEMRINRYINRNVGALNARPNRGLMRMDFRAHESETRQLLNEGYQIEEHSIDRFVPQVKLKMGL